MSDELTDEQCTLIAGAVSKMMGATGGTLTESEGHYLRNFGFALIRAGHAAALREDRGTECDHTLGVFEFSDFDGGMMDLLASSDDWTRGEFNASINKFSFCFCPDCGAKLGTAAPIPEDRAEPVRRKL